MKVLINSTCQWKCEIERAKTESTQKVNSRCCLIKGNLEFIANDSSARLYQCFPEQHHKRKAGTIPTCQLSTDI